MGLVLCIPSKVCICASRHLLEKPLKPFHFSRYAAEKYEPNDRKRKFGIRLTTADKVFELYAPTDQARTTWLEVLNEDVKSYHTASILER